MNVLTRLFFNPGGVSYVIFKLDCNKIDGNLEWGSLVNQSLNFLSGCNVLISFSRVGSQDVTRWRFFKNTQCPFWAAFFTISIAISFYPPPIANSWKHYLPTTVSANSYNSELGSDPGDIINRIGSNGEDSFSYMFLNSNGEG